jgi:hypothetical protein
MLELPGKSLIAAPGNDEFIEYHGLTNRPRRRATDGRQTIV